MKDFKKAINGRDADFMLFNLHSTIIILHLL
jgi:hypothetical protein